MSASLELSLALDSCCSVSFCSLNHAERVQQLHPDLKMTKLTKPVAINVASEDAVLQGIVLQDVPITRGAREIIYSHNVSCSKIGLTHFAWQQSFRSH